MFKSKKKIAVIGCGYWGKNLARNFFELGALGAIVDPNLQTAQLHAKQYDVPALDMNEALADSDIKAVVIAAPAELHKKLALQAIAAGKDIYVEKPLALSTSDGEEIRLAAESAGVTLMVGHLLQYHPVFQKIKEIVQRGDIGEINYVYSNRLSFGKVRSKEDVIWSFAPHDISMILSLVGEEPEHISCKSSSFLQKNLADIASIHMKFKSGIKSDIRVSWVNPLKEVKLVVTGKSGMLVFDDTKTWNEKLALHSYEIDHLKGLNLKKTKEEYIKVIEEEPLKNECQHFIDVVDGISKPLTDAFEGLKVLKVLTAASVKEKNQIIK